MPFRAYIRAKAAMNLTGWFVFDRFWWGKYNGIVWIMPKSVGNFYITFNRMFYK